ncbi:MAG: polyprenyl synthetase family protein [Bacteroidales bacterium]|nr:polyprenyl synthetase family protein [Bacteroidales bacterium]
MQTLLNKVQEIFASEQFIHEPKELYEPIDYTLRLGGKRIRPMLLLAANQMFNGDLQQVHHAAVGIETFHNFTLLHDDLMDKSPIRRGKPTVYRKWDENTAILSGDTMFALAWRYFLVQPHARLQEILNCFNETAILVCEGQQYDMNFEQRDNVTVPEYMMMIRLKTAVLLAGALKIGALYANAPEQDINHLYEFGIHLGLAFQLQDDLLDSFGDVAEFGKQTGQDIRDNKKTYLFLSALQTAPADLHDELLALFSSTPQNNDEKVARVLQIYRQLGIPQTVEDAIAKEFREAVQHLDAINVEEPQKRPLRELTTTLFGRKK